MKRIIAPVVFAAFVWTGAQALADEPTTTSATMSHHQMMKDCMARQKAQNSSMSKEDMKKACKDQVGSQNSAASGQPTNDQPMSSSSGPK